MSESVVIRQPINFGNLDGERVVVTHIENPEKFFCRLASNDNQFNEMNELIWTRVRSPFAERPSPHSLLPDEQVLAFSTINHIWCRSRIEEVLNNGVDDPKKMSLKLYLIDIGSVEVITYNNIRQTSDEIIDYNSGQSFCFECRLYLIKPISESQQWSSYANYLFKKQTKDNFIRLKFDSYSDGVVICDLTIQWPNDCSKSCLSLVDFLVATRVGRYRMGHDFYHPLIPGYDPENHNPEDFEYNSDEDLNTKDFKNENKLYFV